MACWYFAAASIVRALQMLHRAETLDPQHLLILESEEIPRLSVLVLQYEFQELTRHSLLSSNFTNDTRRVHLCSF
ncbi:hypothetical protein F4801DRAFT_220259 [Xylaria longipes]|nr:hypothetical protein F4801DRAFT_220259 [Xylaria longipes]